MTGTLLVSVLYIVAAVVLTLWLTRELYRNGLELLRQRNDQQTLLAEATSKLLTIGFALFTLGYAFLLLRPQGEMEGMAALQFLVQRLGFLLVSLGLLHQLSTLVFLRFRRSRAEEVATEAQLSGRRRASDMAPDEDTPSEQARRRGR